MNNITVVLFSIILIGILLYYVIKNHCVNKMSKEIKKENYKGVITLSNKSFMQHFLSAYVCDLYRVRAYFALKDEGTFKQELEKVLAKDYALEKRKQFLELYFHYFLLKNDRPYAEKFLAEIEKIGEPSFSFYNKQAFDVMMDHNNDLIEVMESEINSKEYNGFALGVLVYMMGIQYLRLNNKEEARTYFYNSLACFHKHDIYVQSARKYVNDLSQELGLDSPTY